MRARLALAAALVVAGCVTRRVTPREAGAAAVGTPGEIENLVRLALTLDAAGDRSADTLYAPEAIVVGNARIRFAAPRFAGVSYGGRITVTAASVTLEGRFAWVMVDYRWINTAQRLAEAGRATFICEQKSGSSWKIVHVHSSQLLPWDH